jgi:hypothetical protein
MKDACRDEGCRKNKKKKLRASEEWHWSSIQWARKSWLTCIEPMNLLLVCGVRELHTKPAALNLAEQLPGFFAAQPLMGILEAWEQKHRGRCVRLKSWQVVKERSLSMEQPPVFLQLTFDRKFLW